MVNVKETTINEILQRQEAQDPKALLEYLFAKNVLNVRLCRIALIRKHYFDLLRKNPDLQIIDAKELTAEDFAVSVETVNKAIYYYSKVDI